MQCPLQVAFAQASSLTSTCMYVRSEQEILAADGDSAPVQNRIFLQLMVTASPNVFSELSVWLRVYIHC